MLEKASSVKYLVSLMLNVEFSVLNSTKRVFSSKRPCFIWTFYLKLLENFMIANCYKLFSQWMATILLSNARGYCSVNGFALWLHH